MNAIFGIARILRQAVDYAKASTPWQDERDDINLTQQKTTYYNKPLVLSEQRESKDSGHLLLFFLILCHTPTLAFDNAHFYRATLFPGEPRLEERWLTTWEFWVAGGKASSGRNNQGHKTNLLNIYGPQHAQFLGAELPNLDPANPLDQILINLAALPTRPGFGDLAFAGKFSIAEADINFMQNFIHGFFFQAYLPIRSLALKNITYQDLSPADIIANPTWQAFLSNFPAILNRYNLSINPLGQTGVGDLSLLLGWAHNHQNTTHLDYIDIDARIGVLIPTAKQKNEDQPFSMPLGYNGHYGVPLRFDGALGACEWLTAGITLDAVFFFNRNKTVRIKTAQSQNGFIKLASANVNVDQGTVWNITPYIKADHVCKGLSLLLGYTFSQQDKTTLCNDQAPMANAIINTDSQLKSWSMHTLHFMAEYDFTQSRIGVGPRVGLNYYLIVGGQRIFNTSVAQGTLTLDIGWDF